MITLLPAFLAGILTSALSSFEQASWLQIIALAWFWNYLDKHNFQASRKQAKLGWAFGFGYFSLGLWWLYISLHDVGGMPAIQAIGGVLLLSGFLALFPSFAVWLGTRFHYRSYSAISWAAAWTFSEWLRGHILTGFPWIGYGDSQVSGPFMGIIPIFGSLGATFAVLWTAHQLGSIRRHFFKSISSVALLILICSLLEGIQYTQAVGKLLEVRLVQGNFLESMHFNPEKIRTQINFYTQSLTSRNTDLVITPETAFPIPADNLPVGLTEQLQDYAKKNQTHLLTGIIGKVGDKYSNRAMNINPNGSIYTYDKEHLVPFGEYVPFGFRWFTNAIEAPLSDFARGGKEQDNLVIQRPNEIDLHAAITICYEDVFGDELAYRLRHAKNDTNLLINMTNLAWFGHSQAPEQQLRLSRLRSLETGLPGVRATNTGVTAFINSEGKVVQRLAEFKQDSLVGSLQARTGKTPYVRWGDWPLLYISLLILAISTIRLRRSQLKGEF